MFVFTVAPITTPASHCLTQYFETEVRRCWVVQHDIKSKNCLWVLVAWFPAARLLLWKAPSSPYPIVEGLGSLKAAEHYCTSVAAWFGDFGDFDGQRNVSGHCRHTHRRAPLWRALDETNIFVKRSMRRYVHTSVINLEFDPRQLPVLRISHHCDYHTIELVRWWTPVSQCLCMIFDEF